MNSIQKNWSDVNQNNIDNITRNILFLNSGQSSFPSSSGIYSIVLSLKKEIKIVIGTLGFNTLPLGTYVYTGSAFGSGGLRARINRHLRKKRGDRIFWHIDSLLTNDEIEIMGVVAIKSDRNLECKINKLIRKEIEGDFTILGFGSSDCKTGCGTHLVFSSESTEKISMKYLFNIYSSFSYEPLMFSTSRDMGNANRKRYR